MKKQELDNKASEESLADQLKRKRQGLDYIYALINRIENYIGQISVDHQEYYNQERTAYIVCKISASLGYLYTLTGNNSSIYRCQLVKDLQERTAKLLVWEFVPGIGDILVLDKSQLEVFKPVLHEFFLEVNEKIKGKAK